MEKLIDAISDKGATMVGYIHDLRPEMPHRNKLPAIIICPGGGYEFISARESDPVALSFFAQGYNTFVLNYSVKENARSLQPQIMLC